MSIVRNFCFFSRLLVSARVRVFSSHKIVKTPSMADSITQGTLASWEKKEGDEVTRDELVANIETDKVVIPVNSPDSGVITKTLVAEGATVSVGSDLFELELREVSKPKEKVHIQTTEHPEKEKKNIQPEPPTSPLVAPVDKPAPSIEVRSDRNERKEPMSRMRARISERMKEAQNTAASLTTFNEVDMSNLNELRKKYKEPFHAKHKFKLSLMSPFVMAASRALREFPMLNVRVEGSNIVHQDYVDISVAVSTPKVTVGAILGVGDACYKRLRRAWDC